MPSQDALLRFVEDELAHSEALAERCAAGTLELLRDVRPGAAGTDRESAFDASQALQRRTSDFVRSFALALRRHVEHEMRHAEAPIDPGAGIGGLELLDESRVEIDIEISRAMQLIDATAEWELRELQTFTSTLSGQKHVSAESTPLRPLAYATALWEACSTVAAARPQQTLLLRTASGVLAGLLKKAWAAASSRLEAQGVEPGVYRTVVLQPGAAERAAIDASGAGTGGSGGGPIGAFASRTGTGGGGAGGAPSFSMPGPGPSRQTQIVDWLARLFALIQADMQVPAPARAVIARLQVSALRLAIQEPRMLDQRNHPLWRLIDAIAQASIAYPAVADPRMAALLTFCETLADEVSQTRAGGEEAALRKADARLQAFLAEQWQAQAKASSPAAAALQRAERRELLELRLSQRLSEQMSQISAPPAVRRFVTSGWAKVIAESMIQHGETGEPTQTWLKTVDDLLWSLRTPDHPQSRQRLLTLLPTLLQRLREGMLTIALPAAEQQAVFDALMAVHTEALRPGGRHGGGPMTPEQIVQQMRDEVIDETPHERPFADSLIDISTLETVPAELMSGDGEPAATNRVATLEPGMRQRVFLHGRWSRVQLLWRSDQGLYLLFAGEHANRTHSLTRRALERLDAAGLVQPLESRPLVQRTLDTLRSELALPA